MGSLKLLKPCRFAWDPAWAPNLHATNPYLGCSFDCAYCWAKEMARRFKRTPEGGWRNVQIALAFETYYLGYFADRVKGELNSLTRPTILVGATCDPYPPLERLMYLTQTIILKLKKTGHKVLVLTKSPIVCRDWELLKAMGAWVGLTLTAPAGVDTRPWEPYAPSNGSRIAALKFLHGKGVKTFTSIEPWLVAACDYGAGMPRKTLREFEYEGWSRYGHYRDYTQPWRIVEETHKFVDYFIIGSWNVAGRPKRELVPYYRATLPSIEDALKATGKPYWIKQELRGLNDQT